MAASNIMNLTGDLSSMTLQSNFSVQSFQNIDTAELESVGYNASNFSGRENQLMQVMDELDKLGFIPENLIESETKWFYDSLGIENTYFARESVSNIVSHIIALYSAKLDAFARGVTDKPFLHHSRTDDDHAVYFEASTNDFETKIDDKYLDTVSNDKAYRMESFNTFLPSDNAVNVKCHFIYKCDFNNNNNNNNNDLSDNESVDINKISDKSFLEIATNHTKQLYTEAIQDVLKTEGPVIKFFTIPSTGELRVIIGYHRNSSPRYNSSLTTLYNYYGLNVKRKYVEQFSNGVSILSTYIGHSDNNNNSELIISQIIKEASLLYTIPNNKFIKQFSNGELSIQECIYAHCGVIFVSHFLNRLGSEFTALKEILTPSNNTLQNIELINKIKNRLTSETYTESYIEDIFQSHPQLIKQLYRNFVDDHYVSSSIEKTLSYQRVSEIGPIKNKLEFENLLNRICSQNEKHMLVFKALFSFNESILKTNFFITSKIAISFRLDSNFLPSSEYPVKPFGLFFVVGSDFRGFHIRFRDIARGGIRIVKSKSLDAYTNNMRNLFDENYNLASTQQRKNKDIPEGGAKGVILLNPGSAQERPKECFTKYIDSLLDVLLKYKEGEEMIDKYSKQEILFMGPDENTANYVDWATLHARKRGAPWWKSFFTGKSPSLGGIPHDEYGMTTLSVRSYVEKIYEKLNITDLKTIFKVQTGGPDGDLGSNEILLSKDETYVALVDGSGVIVDENGINKLELIRLAKERKMIENFDKSKLSSKGYIILVDDVDFKLPNGEIITSGLTFRNLFHLKIKEVFGKDKVKLFVPCGGRPSAIDANNVRSLIDEETGKSIVPIFVEGANLFITQPAKLILEKAGAIVFKDASTNKGGVTSSSLEVLASLSFDDQGFLSKMCVDSKTGEIPSFYKNYVKEVQSIIVRNAENEFESLWKLKNETGKTFSELSDELSVAINKLGDELANSKELWEDDHEFRNSVLIDALPNLLLKEIGIENILKRVPIAYLKAIFATRLASEFVYTKGIDASPAKFLAFISELKRKFNQV